MRRTESEEQHFRYKVKAYTKTLCPERIRPLCMEGNKRELYKMNLLS